MSKNTDRFEWSTGDYLHSAIAWTSATDSDGLHCHIALHVTYPTNALRPHVSLTVDNHNNFYDTDNASDWGVIERIIPRLEWPKQIWAGRKGDKERDVDTALSKCIDDFYKRDVYGSAIWAHLNKEQLTFLQASDSLLIREFGPRWNGLIEDVLEVTFPERCSLDWSAIYRLRDEMRKLLFDLHCDAFSTMRNSRPCDFSTYSLFYDARDIPEFEGMPDAEEFFTGEASLVATALETPFM